MAEGVPGIHCALGDLHDSCFTWFFPPLLSLFSVYKHLCPEASVFKYVGDVIIMLVSKLTESTGGGGLAGWGFLQWFVLIRSHAQAVVSDSSVFAIFQKHCRVENILLFYFIWLQLPM